MPQIRIAMKDNLTATIAGVVVPESESTMKKAISDFYSILYCPQMFEGRH
jgi:hypothetical protein